LGDRLAFATESRLELAGGRTICLLTNRLEIVRAPNAWLFIWDATFRADEVDVIFGDQEEMGFGARVATDLTELNGGTLVSSSGQRTARGTWGQAAAWCDYSDLRENWRVGLTLMADPANFRASWWHNRDYGVFVANPFGRAAMKQGAPSAVTLRQGESLRLRFAGAASEDSADRPRDPAVLYQLFVRAKDSR
jgi:hypothetical protein